MHTKSDKFLEKLKKIQNFNPPPHFRKIMFKFFMIDMVAYMQGGMMVSVSCFDFLNTTFERTYPEP